MFHKKTSFIFSLASLITCNGFEGEVNPNAIVTVALPPSHFTGNIVLRTEQPRPQNTKYDAIACATTTCGCAACCCIGPVSTPVIYELVRTGMLFAVAAFANIKKQNHITITSSDAHVQEEEPKK